MAGGDSLLAAAPQLRSRRTTVSSLPGLVVRQLIPKAAA